MECTRDKFIVTFLPFNTDVEVTAETSILDAAKIACLPLKASCGGSGTCGDCIVEVVKGNFNRNISAALSDDLTFQGYTLACQTNIKDNLIVRMPQFQELSIRCIAEPKFFEEHKNLISGFLKVAPAVEKVKFRLPSASLEDNSSDFKRLERALSKNFKNITCGYSVLKKLSNVVRERDGDIEVILFKSQDQTLILDIHSIEKDVYGVACDIGTTTVAVYLVNIETGKIVGTAASYNHQIKCGEDIISRIAYAQKTERLQELHGLVIMTINSLIQKLADSALVSPCDIYYASISGNTTMIHLLLDIDPQHIRKEPYVPTLNSVPILLSSDLGLRMNSEARVFCAPSVGSYVGGDITAGLLCTPILRDSDKISLFIDIGTNGELVIGNMDWLMTCACSAGPAFEGRGTGCGMPASEGAIENIKLNKLGEIEYKVIGDIKPKGVCGSGLVDLLAELFVNGYIDRHGKFKEEKPNGIILNDKGERGFIIVPAVKSYWGKDLIINENDIANLIRTKGAVFSACLLLLKNVGIDLGNIESFYIAGGFGHSLNIDNAIRIGLLPDLERSKFHYLGNSSLLGAYLILISDKNRELVNKTCEKMTYIELNTEPRYMNEYTGALFLPHTDINLFPSVKKLLDSI